MTGTDPLPTPPVEADQRRRRMVAGAVAAVAVVLAALLGAFLLTRDDDDVTAGDTTTTDATTTTARDTTTAAPGGGSGPGDAEGIAVAVDSGGRVVVLDAESGNVDRVLAEDVRVDDPAKNAVAVTPDRTEAFFTRPDTTGDAATPPDIMRVETAGDGEPEVVTQGYAPAVSPDGRQLAYARTSGATGALLPEPEVVIRDRETGEERTLARDDEPAFHFISDLAWSRDAEWLILVAGEVQTTVWAVDPQAADLDGAQRVGPQGRGREEGSSWRAIAAYEDGVAVAETCCQGDEPERGLVLFVSIDPPEVEGPLLPDGDVNAFRLDTDDGTDDLLYVEDGGPEGGRLHRWTAGEDAVELSGGIIVAAW